MGDAGVEFVAPLGRDRGPVRACGGAVLGELFQGLADAGQGQAYALGDADEGHTAQGVAVVAALVAGGAAAVDEALAFVEVQCRDGHSGALGHLADGEFLGYGCHGFSLGGRWCGGVDALEGVQACVGAAAEQELVVGAGFGEAVLVEEQDAVGGAGLGGVVGEGEVGGGGGGVRCGGGGVVDQ